MIKLHIKKVAFPPEHGSWGFVLEPLILALLVAYSKYGMILVLTSFIIFLNHQPVRILLDKKKRSQFYLSALFFFVLYSASIVLGLTLVLKSVSINNLIPFFTALFLMFIFFVMEISQKGRHLIAEFIAPFSIALIAMSVTLIKGWSIPQVLAFGTVLISRSIPTVFYIHIKVQFLKGKNISGYYLHIAEGVLFALTVFWVYSGLLPKLSLLAELILIARAFYGLTENKIKENVKVLGIKEFIFGILYVVIVYLGYHFNL